MEGVKSIAEDITWPDVPFSKYILQCAEKDFPERIAYVDDETGTELKYKQLATHVRAIASSLYHRGVKKGDMVLIFSPNNIMYPCLFHGICSIGAVATTCNPLYTSDELTHHLFDSGAVILVTVKAFMNIAFTAAERYGKLRELFLFDGTGEEDGFVTFEELLAGDVSKFPDVEMSMEDSVAMPYSSGTTGLPKGVLSCNRAFMATIAMFNHKDFQFFNGETDVCLGVVPFYHILGMGIYMGVALSNGAKIVLQSRFYPENFLKAFEKHKVTISHVVPPIAVLLAKHPLVQKLDFSSLKYLICGAAPLASSVIDQLIIKLPHVKTVQLYGMTETLLLTHAVVNGSNPRDSVGKVGPNTVIKVVDTETGKVCGPHETGEIWSKGPGIMTCYYKNTTATANFISEDGFAKTGDLGYYDEEGNFFIVDRLKELIKYNAYQVAPAELESLLLSHPSIADAAVVGMPDEKAGELPRAYVVKKAGCEEVTEEEIIKFIEGQVAPTKKLRGGLEFRSSIPKLPSGKILRRLLKADAAKYAQDKLNRNNQAS